VETQRTPTRRATSSTPGPSLSQRKGLAAPNTAAYAARVRVEGGGGDYGGDSGGFDQLGFGTLAYTL